MPNYLAIIYPDLEAMYADAAGSAQVRNTLQQEGLISNACVLPLSDVGGGDGRRDIDLCTCCIWMGSGRPEALGQIQRPVYFSIDEVRQFLQAKAKAGAPAKSATHLPAKVKKEKTETKSTSKAKDSLGPAVSRKVREILTILPHLRNEERIERVESQLENLLFPDCWGLKWNSISDEELARHLNKEQADVLSD